MEIHLSTATVLSYENRRKSMNLHFHPVVLFSNSWPFPHSHLQNVVWEVSSEKIGNHALEIEMSGDSPFEVVNDRNYIEFHLIKKNVPFQYKDYPCQILFKAMLDSPHTSPIKIERVFWGVTQTKWSKGLR